MVYGGVYTSMYTVYCTCIYYEGVFTQCKLTMRVYFMYYIYEYTVQNIYFIYYVSVQYYEGALVNILVYTCVL